MTKSYGFLGCGMMGQEHIRNLALLPCTKITDVFEPDASMQLKVRNYLPDVKFHPNLDSLLDEARVDAWVITGPNHLHAEQLLKIQNKHPLPILVEKPICTSFEQAKELKKFAKNYPHPVWVGMEYRYMPPIQALIQEARNKSLIGETISLTIREHRFPFLKKVGNWNRFNRNTGGTLVEKCCHFFDLMRLILQSEPIRVYASGNQATNHLDESYEGKTPDILDNALVIIDFDSGKRACLELCMFAEGSKYQEEITLVGTKGKIECLVPGPGRFWDSNLGAPPIPQLIISPRYPKGPIQKSIPVDPDILEAGDHNGSTFYQHQKFLKVLHHEQEVEVGLQDGIVSVLMGLAAHCSIENKQAINFEPFLQKS